MVVDALGNPIRFILSGGQQHDSRQGVNLLNGFNFSAVLADRGYDSKEITNFISSQNAEAVIPSHPLRKVQRKHDAFLYKERNIIERMFNKFKHFRGVATRYNKLEISYMAFLCIAAITIWLK